MNGAPRVRRFLEDQSQRVTRDTSVIAGAVLKAVKGDTENPVLCLNEQDFLTYFTPNNTIESSFDNAYHVIKSYIASSGAMYVMRASKNAMYGGVFCELSDSTKEYIGTGAIEKLSEFVFADTKVPMIITGLNQGSWNDDISIDIQPYQTSELLSFGSYDKTTGLLDFKSAWFTGDKVRLIFDKELPTEMALDYYYLFVENSKLGFAKNLVDAKDGVVIKFDALTNTTITVMPAVKSGILEGCQQLSVRRKGILIDGETYMFSLNPQAKDLNGNSLWVEEVVKYSANIKVTLNKDFDFTTKVNVLKKVSDVKFTGGSNGVAVTDGDLVLALDKFRNPDNIKFKLFIDSGYTSPAYQIAMADMLNSRADSIGLASLPLNLETSARPLNALIDYVNGNVKSINTPYVSFFTTHVKIADKFNNGRVISISPVGFIASLYESVMSSLTPFKAVAGTRRGIMPADVLDLVHYFQWDRAEGGEFGVLYDNNINAIRNIKNRGLVVWGQKNTQRLPSKLDRNNVMMVLITIAPDLENTLNDFLFEDTDRTTWSQIIALINSYMETIKVQGGLNTINDDGYQVIVDESINTSDVIDDNRTIVLLRIKPKSVTEYIDLSIVVLPSGAVITPA